jgi:hypothetical protein
MCALWSGFVTYHYQYATARLSVDENPGLRLAAGFLALSTRSPVMFGWASVCGFSM